MHEGFGYGWEGKPEVEIEEVSEGDSMNIKEKKSRDILGVLGLFRNKPLRGVRAAFEELTGERKHLNELTSGEGECLRKFIEKGDELPCKVFVLAHGGLLWGQILDKLQIKTEQESQVAVTLAEIREAQIGNSPAVFFQSKLGDIIGSNALRGGFNKKFNPQELSELIGGYKATGGPQDPDGSKFDAKLKKIAGF